MPLNKRIIDYRKGERVEVETKGGWLKGTVDHHVSGDIPIVVVKTDNHEVLKYIYCLSESCIRNDTEVD